MVPLTICEGVGAIETLVVGCAIAGNVDLYCPTAVCLKLERLPGGVRAIADQILRRRVAEEVGRERGVEPGFDSSGRVADRQTGCGRVANLASVRCRRVENPLRLLQ